MEQPLLLESVPHIIPLFLNFISFPFQHGTLSSPLHLEGLKSSIHNFQLVIDVVQVLGKIMLFHDQPGEAVECIVFS